MSKNVDSFEDIRKDAISQFEKVVNYVVDKILEENKNVIEEVVYEAGQPSVYNRTGEFKSAWDKRVERNDGYGYNVKGVMEYAPDKMSVGSLDVGSIDYGQHISVAGEYEGQDSRAYLADIIYQGLAGPVFGKGYWQNKRNAFEKLVERIKRERFDKIFREGCAMYGLVVTKPGGIDLEYEK